MPWFTRLTERSWVSRKLDESTENLLIRKYGTNFKEKLSFDELNQLLLSLNYNPYPTT